MLDKTAIIERETIAARRTLSKLHVKMDDVAGWVRHSIDVHWPQIQALGGVRRHLVGQVDMPVTDDDIHRAQRMALGNDGWEGGEWPVAFASPIGPYLREKEWTQPEASIPLTNFIYARRTVPSAFRGESARGTDLVEVRRNFARWYVATRDYDKLQEKLASVSVKIRPGQSIGRAIMRGVRSLDVPAAKDLLARLFSEMGQSWANDARTYGMTISYAPSTFLRLGQMSVDSQACYKFGGEFGDAKVRLAVIPYSFVGLIYGDPESMPDGDAPFIGSPNGRFWGMYSPDNGAMVAQNFYCDFSSGGRHSVQSAAIVGTLLGQEGASGRALLTGHGQYENPSSGVNIGTHGDIETLLALWDNARADHYHTDGGRECDNCGDPSDHRCENCAVFLCRDCVYYGAGDPYCGDCYSERFACCDECGETDYADSMTFKDYRVWCETCLDENYVGCAECREYVHRDKAIDPGCMNDMHIDCFEAHLDDCDICRQEHECDEEGAAA